MLLNTNDLDVLLNFAKSLEALDSMAQNSSYTVLCGKHMVTVQPRGTGKCLITANSELESAVTEMIQTLYVMGQRIRFPTPLPNQPLHEVLRGIDNAIRGLRIQ